MTSGKWLQGVGGGGWEKKMGGSAGNRKVEGAEIRGKGETKR